MSDAGRAVFLSYASQDAEAARRICEALRAAGVEVWFDQSELRGGDAWDQKIRKQIKDCALFVPIVSAATQTRLEGYFRLEWRLADQRSHLMAKGKPFLLPVAVDATSDADAHVPDSFLEVQWTRLPAGENVVAFGGRIVALLEGSAGARAAPSAPRVSGARDFSEKSIAKSKLRRFGWLVPAAVALVGVLIWQWPRGDRSADPKFTTQNSKPPSAPVAPLSEARQLIAKAWVLLNKPEMARAELDAADALCKRAAGLDPTDADAWAAWAQVHSWFLHHGLDLSASRREAGRDAASRAMQLGPNSFEARLAQAVYWLHGERTRNAAKRADGERMLRELLAESPDEPRAMLAWGLSRGGGAAAGALPNVGPTSERATVLERLALNPAFASRALSFLGSSYLFGEHYAEAEATVDRSIAAQPTWHNLGTKISLALFWRGDPRAGVD